MKIALIPCARTEWLDEGRLLGRVELPPAPAADAECEQWVKELRGLGWQQILHAPDELATHTARLLGRQLVVPTKVADALAEVDVGLWSGLTEEDLKSRYASAHRELCEAPLNVNPPGGESLGDADARLKAFLKKHTRRDGPTALALVLRPLSFAMAWCTLEGRAPSDVWERARQAQRPVIIEFPPGPAARGRSRTPKAA